MVLQIKIALEYKGIAGPVISRLSGDTNQYVLKCASPGAAVSNMVSATLVSEREAVCSECLCTRKHKSRMGKTLWDDPEAYIKNSPIFMRIRFRLRY